MMHKNEYRLLSPQYRYAYDPYGNESSGAAVTGRSPCPRTGGGQGSLRYTGRKFDPETGLRHCRGLLHLQSIHWID